MFFIVVIFGCIPVCQQEAMILRRRMRRTIERERGGQITEQKVASRKEKEPQLHIALQVNQMHPNPLDATH